MVAAARTVAVEVDGLHTVLGQVAPGRPVQLDRTRGRDVIGRNGITQHRKHARVVNVLHRRGRRGHAVEVRRLPDVGRVRLPSIGVAQRELQVLPVRIAVRDRRILRAEHGGVDVVVHRIVHILLRRPDVAQKDRLATVIVAQRLRVKVEVDAARQRIRQHQRRTHQVVGAHVGVDAPLEIAVPAQDADRHQAVLFDRLRNVGRQRSRVADAGRAPVPNRVETQLVQILCQTGLVVVVGHHAATRRKRGLHPGRRLQAFLDGLLRQEARRYHHVGIAGVGAAGDCRNHDRPILQVRIDVDTGARLHAGNRLVRNRKDAVLAGLRRRNGALNGAVCGNVAALTRPAHNLPVAFHVLRIGIKGGQRLGE